MFALLVNMHKGADLFTELTGGSIILYSTTEDTSAVPPPPSPELIAKEQRKAQHGYCETYLWNCTDLCEFGVAHVELPLPSIVFSDIFYL